MSHAAGQLRTTPTTTVPTWCQAQLFCPSPALTACITSAEQIFKKRKKNCTVQSNSFIFRCTVWNPISYRIREEIKTACIWNFKLNNASSTTVLSCQLVVLHLCPELYKPYRIICWCSFPAAFSAPMWLMSVYASTGLAARLSGVFTGNMASLSVGELQEMEGE